MDEEIGTYFREEGLNGSDEGESDTELEPEPPMLNLFEPEVHDAQEREEPRVLVLRENHNAEGVEVDEDEDEDEEEDEEEDDDQDPEDEIVLRQRRAPLRAAVAFDADGIRRAVPLDVNAPPPLALAPMAGLQAIPQPQQGPQPMNADDALLMDDLEAGVEDDMEGALEAIGLRGPIYGLLQNAILMIFIMDTVIGLGIWVPYTLGKSMAFLVLEPRQLLFILHLPVRAIRLLTDPAVDLAAYFFLDVVLPPHIQLLKNLISWIVQLSFWIISELLGEGNANKAREYSLATHSLLENSLDWFVRTIGLGENSAQVAADSTPELIANSSFLPQTFPIVIGHIEPYFAPLGRELVTDQPRESSQFFLDTVLLRPLLQSI
ncbi:hypothetical protein GGU11DRAFT_812640 [Lentinula aff. detonsa]|nr:hypothetical protein GGU11DRAFT_812640 [Lentinula aff. detonsa]